MPRPARAASRRNVHSRTLIEEFDLDSANSMPHIPMLMSMEPGDDDSDSTEEHDHSIRGLKGDRQNIALLTFLYVLQGIPLGLAGSIPYLLQSRNVSYKDQAVFSFVYWPFSLKLLWAPIVDSTYFPVFGRRKSWLVPTQYLIGLFMLLLSYHMSDLLGEGEGENHTGVSVTFLTVVFFMLNFLAATQDIAVDGWALTMLSRKNVGWASTCNTVGQTAGYFLGNILFLALESPDFCNSYLRDVPCAGGVVTLGGFLYFWGIVFLITTTLVMVLKRENNSSNGYELEEADSGIVDTYVLLWKIVKLPAVLSLIGVLLTVKMGFAAADSATGLKLLEAGVPKDRLAMIGVPMVPIQVLLPIFISRYTAGPRPMDIYLKAMPFRLVMGLIFGLIVYWGPSTRGASGEYPTYFYLVVILVYALHQVTLYCMFVSHMGFFAKISDPVIGGTYMTLLNTISNFGLKLGESYGDVFQAFVYSMFVSIMGFHARISDPVIGGTYITLLNTSSNMGGNWPSTVALWLLDGLTWKECQGAQGECDNAMEQQACTEAGGHCVATLDGYYIESFACVIIGLFWLKFMSRKVRGLQDLPASSWTYRS